jgi:hypothetical protein
VPSYESVWAQIHSMSGLHTRKVLGSDLGSETAYPESRFSYLHSVHPVVCHTHMLLRLAVATINGLMANQFVLPDDGPMRTETCSRK